MDGAIGLERLGLRRLPSGPLKGTTTTCPPFAGAIFVKEPIISTIAIDSKSN